MPRRVALPGATELFRATDPVNGAGPRPSGRVKHDEKITVYVSADELVALEQARLTLRARHGVAVDRGRIVRAAIALSVADLELNGDDCDLIRQLDVP
ncbi:MAG: hypothetical protein IPL41_07175 [Micropruina sp.]|nr:hypothetical protein [Micropruina sp.]